MGREANTKKIKTESGRKIAASYKSQVYQRWRERHKINAIFTGEVEGEEGGAVTGIYVCRVSWFIVICIYSDRPEQGREGRETGEETGCLQQGRRKGTSRREERNSR